MRAISTAEPSTAANSKYLRRIALAVLAGGLLALASRTAHPQAAVELVAVDVVAVAKGYRTSKLTGETVLNPRNEEVGEIDDFIIGRDRVLFAILEVGGFLGIGSRLVAVPYEALQINEDGTRIVLAGATKEQVGKMPEFKYRAPGNKAGNKAGDK